MTAGSANISQAQFPAAFLQALGFPAKVYQSQAWQDVIDVWTQAEGPKGGAAWNANNPLNANCNWSGQTGCITLSNGAKIGVYPDLQTAANSYATGGGVSGWSGLSKANSPLDLANKISNTDWVNGNGQPSYQGYKATLNKPTGPPVSLTGLGALLFTNKAGSNADYFNQHYTILGGNANVQPGDTVGGAVSTVGNAATNASNTASNLGGGINVTVDMFSNVGKIIGDWIGKPDFPINAIVLLTGLIMLVLGLKSLVGSQAGQAINIIGGTTNDVRNSRVAGSIREGINVAGQPAEAVPADFKPEPASETFTLPEFLKQVSTSESQSYSPETPRAASPSKSALRHRATRAQDRAAIAAFNAAPAEALV